MLCPEFELGLGIDSKVLRLSPLNFLWGMISGTISFRKICFPLKLPPIGDYHLLACIENYVRLQYKTKAIKFPKFHQIKVIKKLILKILTIADLITM